MHVKAGWIVGARNRMTLTSLYSVPQHFVGLNQALNVPKKGFNYNVVSRQPLCPISDSLL